MIDIRNSLNGGCEGCGKDIDDAQRVVPVAHGRWSIGPEWFCDDCHRSQPEETP